MPSILKDLSFILPEIIIIFGALVALICAVYSRNKKAKTSLVITIVSVLLAFHSNLVSQAFVTEIEGFSQMLIHNSMTIYAKGLVLICALVVLIMFSSIIDKEKYTFFEMPVIILLSIAGMLFLISSNSLMSLYMGLEMMSLPLYIMAASNRTDSNSSEAGIKYFVLGTLASGIFLLGCSFVYAFTGTINFPGIYEFYANLSATESVIMPIGFLIGMVLILVAFAFKISAVPFHMWTPDVYEGSPTLVTAFFATAPKIAGFAILIRTLFEPFADLYDQWQQIIVFIAVASMFVGGLGAIMQKNFKRLLAYSSIGHVGFALSGLVTAEAEGVQAVLVYLTLYITMTFAAFGALMLLKKEGRSIDNIADLAGLSKSFPNIALGLAITLLSMAGIPPFAGFFIKFYILIPVFKDGLYGLGVMFVVASVIATFYYLKIIKVMYFDSSSKDLEVANFYAIKVVVFICVMINLLYIIVPANLFDAAQLVSLVLFR